MNATDARTVVCLLDLLVLEGIYPSLSTGVGIPIERRARNFVVPATRKKVQEVEDGRDVEMLGRVVGGLLGAMKDAVGVGKTARERCLVDVLAGCGELAFEGEGTEEWKGRWGELVDRSVSFTPVILLCSYTVLYSFYCTIQISKKPDSQFHFYNHNPSLALTHSSIPTPSLLSSLLSLLHPSTPPYFRTPLTRALSTLPLRPNAIRHILELFLSTVSDSSLSIDALSNASRIIGAIPTSVSADEYFAKVCPQLLELLDAKDSGLARGAGFILAELLGRKGKVEGIIEREVVQVIISGLDPAHQATDKNPPAIKKQTTSSALLSLEDAPPPPPPLIPEPTLSLTLHRLSHFLSHPSPSASSRLLPPLLLPLWALLCYARKTSRTAWHARVLSILHSHLKTTPSVSILSTLQHNILFSGSPIYEFAPGDAGGIEARVCTGNTQLDMSVVEARIEEFLVLLEDVPEGVLNEFFLGLLRVWFAREEEKDQEAVGMFTTLKILQEVLARHEGALAKAPTQTLQIVGGVLAEYVSYKEGLKQEDTAVVDASLGGLGRIVKEEQGEDVERVETVTMALSLLSVVVSSPTVKLTGADERLVETLRPALEYIVTDPGIDKDLAGLGVNVVSLLSLNGPVGAPAAASLTEQQKESYILALSYLHDPLIPVRAHGLHLLRELIMAKSPVVDITNTLRLLIGMLKDGDSFVYLNVVKCLAALTDRHSKTVTRMLVEAYIDDDAGAGRLGLDERLRIGEALLGTVQRLGGALVGETAEMIATGMVGLVSRRRKREGGDAEEEWGSDEEEEKDGQTEEMRKEERSHKVRILRGWQSKDQSEDLRIRTSALSILGAAIETNAQGLGGRVLTDAVDMSLSILTLETAVEKAILRRAAVMCVGSVLKSLVGMNSDGDSEGRSWREGVWEVIRARVGEVRRVLGYVRGADNDGLVREQAGVVGENLEAVVERWMLGGRSGGVGIVEIGTG